MPKRTLSLLTIVMVFVTLLAACASSSTSQNGAAPSTSGAASSSSAAASSGAASAAATTSDATVTLEFWSWVPNIEAAVDLWNQTHPNVKVNFTRTAAGTDAYNKLKTAIAAGSGAPDVAQIEYQYLTSMVVGGVVEGLGMLVMRPFGCFVLVGVLGL